jgi:hyaluronan synthase
MSSIIPFWGLLFIIVSSLVVVAKAVSIYALLVNKNVNEVKRDWNYKPKVTIMMSAFNESKDVFECIKSIMESDYPQDKLEVVAFDDQSKDDTWSWLQKAEQLWPGSVVVRRNEVNLGKAVTMTHVSKASTGEILIGTDSDTIFDSETIKEMVSCFADPEIGGVGGQIRIKNVNDSLLTQFQALYYVRVYYFYKTLENIFGTARCLAGPIVAYRREIFMPMMDRVLGRNFLGEHIAYGEDTFLTSHLAFGLIDKKWKIFTNLKAICWTGTPKTWTAYLNQQLRWRRGTIVNGIRVLSNLRHNVRVGGVATTMLCVIPMITTFAMLVMGIYLLALGSFLPTLFTAVLSVFMISAGFGYGFNLTLGKTDRMGPIKNPILTGMAYAMWTPVTLYWLTIIAMFTLDDGGWVTRQNTGNTG